MNKTTEALELAEALENDAKEHREVSYGLDCPPERTANWQHALNCEAAARLIREALAEPVKQEPVAFHRASFLSGYEAAQSDANACDVPPQGWICTRQAGHDGPCAAIEDNNGHELVSRAMSRLAEQDAAPVEPVKQEPVAVISESAIGLVKLHSNGACLPFGTQLYAAPVRTKDLTDYEIVRLYAESPMCDSEMIAFARAVIAADREKNKC